jgi:predicted ester cyclase
MKKIFSFMLPCIIFLVACNDNTATKTDTRENEKVTHDDTESKEERNKQAAVASVQALLSGDVDGTVKYLAQDVTDYGDGKMPPVKGKDSVKSMLQTWRSAMSEYKADNMITLADSDYVTVYADWSGTYKSDIMGIKLAGKSFKAKDADIFKFNNEGLITEHHNILPMDYMFAQMGVKMPKN